jgi:hypothetical protein
MADEGRHDIDRLERAVSLARPRAFPAGVRQPRPSAGVGGAPAGRARIHLGEDLACVLATIRAAIERALEREETMQLGVVGLGRMGANISRRLMHAGHQCGVYDLNATAVESLVGEGATGSSSLGDFVAKLAKPRAAWLMVPAAFAGESVSELGASMEPGDVVIDGGNSYYRDDTERAHALAPQEHSIH